MRTLGGPHVNDNGRNIGGRPSVVLERQFTEAAAIDLAFAENQEGDACWVSASKLNQSTTTYLKSLGPKMDDSTLPPSSEKLLTSQQALTVAHADAERAYGDVSRFRIRMSLETDGWHIDYEIKEPLTKGGAPKYIIDASSGEIISKRYFQ